jgi:hypothetical protein
MVNAEFGQGDNPAKIGDEAAEHAGLVERAERPLRRMARRQELQKELIGGRVGSEAVVDQLERGADQANGFGMQKQVSPLRFDKKPDEIERVLRERIRRTGSSAAAGLRRGTGTPIFRSRRGASAC